MSDSPRPAWIDLTRTLENGMIQWPGDPPFCWERILTVAGPGTCNLSQISTSVHIGTHIDAPLHFIEDGGDIAGLPLTALCGPATVVDVRAQRDVSVQDLEDAAIPRGDRVLLKTVNAALWQRAEFAEDFTAISGEAAQWLVEHQTPLVGVDYLSVDGFHDPAKPVHYMLLGHGVVIIEGVDLSELRPGRYELVALPLKIVGGDGSPARVIARPYGP